MVDGKMLEPFDRGATAEQRPHFAGGGGWKDPLDRPPEIVEADVAKGLVSTEKAERDYGVVLTTDGRAVDGRRTAERRAPPT